MNKTQKTIITIFAILVFQMFYGFIITLPYKVRIERMKYQRDSIRKEMVIKQNNDLYKIDSLNIELKYLKIKNNQ